MEQKTSPQQHESCRVGHPLLQLQQSAGNQMVLQMAKVNMKHDKPHKTKPSKAKKSISKLGKHGGKKTEQKRLTKKYGFTVSGNTHESEHTIGFEPLNQTSGLKRGQDPRAIKLENEAPAYQEEKRLHRKHIGTGNTGEVDKIKGPGFNSEQYRHDQRSLLEAGDVSSAVQINQLGYAFVLNNEKEAKEHYEDDDNPIKLEDDDTPVEAEDDDYAVELQAANNSYDQMVENMNSFTYAQGDDDRTISVDAKQKAEMYLARRTMLTGKFPTIVQENEARKKFGLPPYE